MKIYDIQAELRDLLDEVNETGELTEIQAQLMDDLHGELESKQKGIIYYIQEAKGFESIIKEEEKRLKTKKRVLKNKQQRLLDLLGMTMEMEGKRKLDFGDIQAVYQKTPPALEVDEYADIPQKYIKIVESINKTELKKAVKNGLVLEGVKLTQKETLRIK